MTIKSIDCIGLDKKAEMEHNRTHLYYKGRWVLRTTETGVEINPKTKWYEVVRAYTKYIWIKVRDAIINGDNGPTSMVP